MTTRDCVFCDIIGDPVHQAPIYRDDRVIPNMHLGSLAYVGPGQVPVMGHMFVVAEEMARREGATLSGYRLTLNQGQDSGQEIEHLHLHLMAGRKLSAMG